MTIIDRARKALDAHPGVARDATSDRIVVPAAAPDGFAVSLEILGAREFRVRYEGWHHRFSRAEDAYDCFELGLSDSCRLRVTMRGSTPVAWQIVKKEYGLWVPGRRIASRLVPFWRPRRVVDLQNRVFRDAPGTPPSTGQDANPMNLSQHATGSNARSDAEFLDLLARFADAWNRHDLDALMSMMTDDCVFEASAGPQVDGQRSEGQQAVRAAYAAVFDAFPDAQWAAPRHFIAGTRGVSEWTFTGTRDDGRRVEVSGCDLFTFRDGRIAIKNSFRKNRPAL